MQTIELALCIRYICRGDLHGFRFLLQQFQLAPQFLKLLLQCMDLRDIGTLVQIGAAVSPARRSLSSSASSSLTVLRSSSASRSALFMPGVSLSFIKIQLLQVYSFQFALKNPTISFASSSALRSGWLSHLPLPPFCRTYRGASLSISIKVW